MEQTFEPTKLIIPDAMPIPKVGNIGYVKFENPYEYIGETNPQWIDVDEHEFETIR